MTDRSSAESELLLELFSGAGGEAAERFRERRARALLSDGQAARASLFALRQQEIPEAPLSGPFFAGLFALESGTGELQAPEPIDGVRRWDRPPTAGSR